MLKSVKTNCFSEKHFGSYDNAHDVPIWKRIGISIL